MPKGDSKIRARTVMGPPGAAAFFGPPQLRLWQQMVRSGLYMLQFAVGYFIMLLAMYYNGTFSRAPLSDTAPSFSGQWATTKQYPSLTGRVLIDEWM